MWRAETGHAATLRRTGPGSDRISALERSPGAENGTLAPSMLQVPTTMKKISRTLSLCWVVSAVLSAAVACGCHNMSARDPSDEVAERDDGVDEMHEASVVLREVNGMPDAVPASLRRDARCVAVIPAIVKAAFIVGARYGRGVASCRTATSWSAPAFFTVGGGSFGAQVGVQSSDLVLYVMNDDGMRKLLNSRVELGADASVAAGPVGRDATGGKTGGARHR